MLNNGYNPIKSRESAGSTIFIKQGDFTIVANVKRSKDRGWSAPHVKLISIFDSDNDALYDFNKIIDDSGTLTGRHPLKVGHSSVLKRMATSTNCNMFMLDVDNYETSLINEVNSGRRSPYEIVLNMNSIIGRPINADDVKRIEAELKQRPRDEINFHHCLINILNSMSNHVLGMPSGIHRGKLHKLLNYLELPKLSDIEAIKLAGNNYGDKDAHRLLRNISSLLLDCDIQSELGLADRHIITVARGRDLFFEDVWEILRGGAITIG